MKLSFFDLYLFWAWKNLTLLPLYAFSSREEQKNRIASLNFGISNISVHGLICEFGVHKGNSINVIANRLPDKIIYGFDSFQGFPEDGRSDWQKDFKTDVPKVNKNIQLVVGFFTDTLDSFLQEKNSKIALAHIDCDIYSSTKTIFDSFAVHDSIQDGSVLVFDELINYKTALWNELLAFYRFLFENGYDAEWLCVNQAVENIDAVLSYYKNNNYPENSILRGDGKYWYQQVACIVRKKQTDYSELSHNEIYKKIKWYSREFQNIISSLSLNCFTDEDFTEQYVIENGAVKTISQSAVMCHTHSLKEIEASVPFMDNAVSMAFPEKYIIRFLQQRKFSPHKIIEIGGGKRFNLYGKFKNVAYTNIDFSSSTGIPTVTKNIVTDSFKDFWESADLIYSNNTLEHIFNPFVAAQQMTAMLKKGGYLFIRAPFAYRYHPVPNDYWRFSPDGLACLFSSLHCLEKGLDIHARRRNDTGSFTNKLDSVPQDEYGGWRETWFSYFIGQKIS